MGTRLSEANGDQSAPRWGHEFSGQRHVESRIDTVSAVYELTCPNCGTKVKVPSGPHSVVPTPAADGTSTGITIDGKSAHRCCADVD
jgi:hypothetical protein